jgi:hypothetical protein
MLEDALKAHIRLFDRSHPQTLILLYNLAALLLNHDRIAEGESLILTGYEQANTTYGAKHPSTQRFSKQISALDIRP